MQIITITYLLNKYVGANTSVSLKWDYFYLTILSHAVTEQIFQHQNLPFKFSQHTFPKNKALKLSVIEYCEFCSTT